jgi:hypothetical protein
VTVLGTPDAYAIALMVALDPIATGTVYGVELEVGLLPSVVKYRESPGSPVIVTVDSTFE